MNGENIELNLENKFEIEKLKKSEADLLIPVISKLNWQILREEEDLLTIFHTSSTRQNIPNQLPEDSLITIWQSHSGGCRKVHCLIKKGNTINISNIANFFLTTISISPEFVVESGIY